MRRRLHYFVSEYHALSDDKAVVPKAPDSGYRLDLKNDFSISALCDCNRPNSTWH